MTEILKKLAEEHRVFRAMIARVEGSFRRHHEDQARKELRESLHDLLPALERHDSIEERGFGHPEYIAQPQARWLLEAIELEHRQIAALSNEMRRLLRSMDQVPWADLKIFTLLLTHKLKQHLETEESQLWAHYERYSPHPPISS